MLIRVLSSNDQPLSNVPIIIRPPTAAPGNELFWPSAIRSITGSDGLCRIDTDPPETFQIEAEFPGGVQTSSVIRRPRYFASQMLTIKFNVS